MSKISFYRNSYTHNKKIKGTLSPHPLAFFPLFLTTELHRPPLCMFVLPCVCSCRPFKEERLHLIKIKMLGKKE